MTDKQLKGLKIANIATPEQIAQITTYTSIHVRRCKDQLTVKHPYKHNDSDGPMFFLCDDNLIQFLAGSTGVARSKTKDVKYDPVKEAKKLFEFISDG